MVNILSHMKSIRFLEGENRINKQPTTTSVVFLIVEYLLITWNRKTNPTIRRQYLILLMLILKEYRQNI